MKRCDVILIDFPLVEGGTKRRPALVVQSDALNSRLASGIVAAITSNLRHVGQSTQTLVDPAVETGSNLRTVSAVKCEVLFTADSRTARVIGSLTAVKCEVLFTADSRTARVIGSLTAATMAKVDDCLRAALGLP